MRVLVLHGPNLNLLGTQLETIDSNLAAQAAKLGFELEVFQANSESALLEKLHARREWFDAVVVNPTSLASVAHTLAEALELIGKRAIEVQLVEGRASVLRDVVEAQVHGEEAYSRALETLAGTREPEKVEEEEEDVERATPPRSGKSIGRKGPPVGPAPVTQGTARKTIGKAAAAGPTANAPSKTIGRVDKPASTPSSGTLTRESVKTKAKERLAGSLAPEALASWARGQWQSLISGASVEPGQKDVLEDVLLTLSASAKANDHLILATIAKLDR